MATFFYDYLMNDDGCINLANEIAFFFSYYHV